MLGTHPSRYQHWKLAVDGEIASLVMDVREDAPYRPGYVLKLNSYDLGVDIELADAVERLRFEHPEVRTVVITSGKERVFSAGANIHMLASSSHGFKVNFCKFTNETRLAIEDASRHSGQKYLAALGGITAGGGYELALACDEILLVDDGNSAVSLPEVPLLGVLPGTGGLTRLVDKRHVRRDHADHWFVRETTGFLRRTLARLDVSSRSLFALIESGSCFAGVLAELAFAADRTYMVALPDDAAKEPRLTLTESNLGTWPTVSHESRLSQRFYGDAAELGAVRAKLGVGIGSAEAEALGLVTSAPDDLDWADEVRLALEERAAMSPDALTGMEANLRFGGKETMETRVFGRLSAWQNWIFIRPNAVGERGALKVYGKGEKAVFDATRV